MNATKWSSLSGFCQYLARAGYCTIDETPKGWYIAYIDKDPATLEKQKRKERREKSDLSEEERERKRIEKQLKKAQREAEGKDESAPTELQKQVKLMRTGKKPSPRSGKYQRKKHWPKLYNTWDIYVHNVF